LNPAPQILITTQFQPTRHGKQCVHSEEGFVCAMTILSKYSPALSDYPTPSKAANPVLSATPTTCKSPQR
jgi:hypothetical protein